MISLRSRSNFRQGIRSSALFLLSLVLLQFLFSLAILANGAIDTDEPRTYPPSSEEGEEGGGSLGNWIGEEKLADALGVILDKAVNGQWPFLESVHERKARYLQHHNQDADEAVKAIVDKRHGVSHRMKSFLISAVPYGGVPASLVRALWGQLRDVALIAALYEHDLDSEDTRSKILGTLVGADIRRVRLSLLLLSGLFFRILIHVLAHMTTLILTNSLTLSLTFIIIFCSPLF